MTSVNEQLKQSLKETLGLFAGFIAVVVGVLQIANPNIGTGWRWTALIVAVGGLLAALYFRSLDARHRAYANTAVAVCLIGAVVCASGLLGLRIVRAPDPGDLAFPTVTTTTGVAAPEQSPSASDPTDSPLATQSAATQTPVETKINSPEGDGSVKACSYFSGTWAPQAGQTLILAARNVSASQKYVEYVFGWKDPVNLTRWRGAQYFNEQAVGQSFEVTLESVPLAAAEAAHSAGSDASNQLTTTATVLAKVRVKRVAGGHGTACPGP